MSTLFSKVIGAAVVMLGLSVVLYACGGQSDEGTASDQNVPEEQAGNGETAQTAPEETDQNAREESSKMNITANGTTFAVTLADNSSAEALADMVREGPLTVNMSDYANMEKVGDLGSSLPRNDEHIDTTAGDVILYQGHLLVIYYGPNSYEFTRLGRVEGVTAQDLKSILGSGDVSVTLSLDE